MAANLLYRSGAVRYPNSRALNTRISSGTVEGAMACLSSASCRGRVVKASDISTNAISSPPSLGSQSLPCLALCSLKARTASKGRGNTSFSGRKLFEFPPDLFKSITIRSFLVLSGRTLTTKAKRDTVPFSKTLNASFLGILAKKPCFSYLQSSTSASSLLSSTERLVLEAPPLQLCQSRHLLDVSAFLVEHRRENSRSLDFSFNAQRSSLW